MTKKNFSTLAMLSIAAMMVLSGCDGNCGSNTIVESRLIGKWKSVDYAYNNPETVEFTKDDRIILTYFLSSGTYEYKIESVSDNTIKFTFDDSDYFIKYEDLKSDSVKFNFKGDNHWYKFNKAEID